jgi:hypothetical protein
MEYGKIACWSKITYWEEAIDVSLKVGENKYTCASEDTTRCQIKQENTEKLWPMISSLVKGDTTITMTGTNFYTAGYTITASYAEIAASSVVVNSETEAVATFDGGVPIYTKEGELTRDERVNLLF